MERDHLQQVAGRDPRSGAEITLQEQQVTLADIESVEAEADGHRSLFVTGEASRASRRFRRGLEKLGQQCGLAVDGEW